jgi:hypothetical protein
MRVDCMLGKHLWLWTRKNGWQCGLCSYTEGQRVRVHDLPPPVPWELIDLTQGKERC